MTCGLFVTVDSEIRDQSRGGLREGGLFKKGIVCRSDLVVVMGFGRKKLMWTKNTHEQQVLFEWLAFPSAKREGPTTLRWFSVTVRESFGDPQSR